MVTREDIDRAVQLAKPIDSTEVAVDAIEALIATAVLERAAQALVSAVVVRPGDRLVVALGRRFSVDECDRLREEFDQYLPDLSVAFVNEAVGFAVQRAGEAGE